MTNAAALKPTITALKALFLNAFTEFLPNISASFEVSITSIRFIVLIEKKKVNSYLETFLPGVSLKAQNEHKRGPEGAALRSLFFIDIDIVLIETIWRYKWQS
jgi:hypothetical protein